MEIFEKLKKLEIYKNSPFPILSICLGLTSKKAESGSVFVTQLHSLVHKNLNSFERKLFAGDLEKIEDYLLSSYQIRNRKGIAFWGSGKNLWQVLEFEFPLPQTCQISNSPYTQTIKKQLKEHNKYLVLLADREKARLFTVQNGEIQEQKKIQNGLVPQQVKAIKTEWGRYDKISRHIDNHLLRHLKLIGEGTKEFTRKHPVNFVIIGSHKELLEKIKKTLPYPLNRKIIGHFTTSANIPSGQALLKSKKIASQIKGGI